MPTQSGASARLWIPRRATVLLAAVAVALTALAGAAADAVATASAAFADANAGSIRIVSDRETSAVYAATRIADADALPLDGVCAPDRNFAWEGVAGQQVGGTSLPSYDPAASNAKEQGRALVQAASDALATDADGSLAAWLATHVTTAGANAAHQVVVNGPAVPVPDGWYLLQSEGKRPLLAWVAGGDVELGDKSDTPTLVKEIKDGDEWLDSGIYGNGQALEYRLILTVPETIKQFANGGTYTCAFHDEWDARLTLVPSSAKLTLVSSANGTRTDITELMTLQAKDSSFTATIDNLCDAAVQPGDTVELTYSMIVDPNAAAGSAGLINTAWATFPSHDGTGETPKDQTKAYAFKVLVKKASPDGAALQGAVFAVRDEAGSWLQEDGSFGAEATRATFESDAQGSIGSIPLLSTGAYALVELEAPEGYRLPQNPESLFTISAEHGFDGIEMKVQAESHLSANVQAESTSVEFTVTNESETGTPPADDGGKQNSSSAPNTITSALAKTWDSLAPLAKLGLILAAVGAAAFAVAAVKRRKEGAHHA